METAYRRKIAEVEEAAIRAFRREEDALEELRKRGDAES